MEAWRLIVSEARLLSDAERTRLMEAVRKRIINAEFEAQRSRIRKILWQGLDAKAAAKLAVEFYKAARQGKGWVNPV